MLGSYKLLRQIAHVSVQMAQDHMATAFHFLISNRGFVLESMSIAVHSSWGVPEVVATSVILRCGVLSLQRVEQSTTNYKRCSEQADRREHRVDYEKPSSRGFLGSISI
jgi:hypothetical protein